MFALGFVSVFDQITEGLPGDGPADIFNAYMAALQEDPEQYRKYVSILNTAVLPLLEPCCTLRSSFSMTNPQFLLPCRLCSLLSQTYVRF